MANSSSTTCSSKLFGMQQQQQQHRNNQQQQRTRLQPSVEDIEAVYLEQSVDVVPKQPHSVDSRVAALWLVQPRTTTIDSTTTTTTSDNSSGDSDEENRNVNIRNKFVQHPHGATTAAAEWPRRWRFLVGGRSSKSASNLLRSVNHTTISSKRQTRVHHGRRGWHPRWRAARSPVSHTTCRSHRKQSSHHNTLRLTTTRNAPTQPVVIRQSIARPSPAVSSPAAAARPVPASEINMSKWREAVDPSTLRTYYYHTESRETQWRKPLELCTDEEREEIRRKEQSQRDFFQVMEANILRKLNHPTTTNSHVTTETPPQSTARRPSMQDQQQQPATRRLRRASLLRTISTMDQAVITDLVKRTPSCQWQNHNNNNNHETANTANKQQKQQDISFLPDCATLTAPDRSTLTRESSQMLSIDQVLSESANHGLTLDDLSLDTDGAVLKKKALSKEPSFGTLLTTLPDDDVPIDNHHLNSNGSSIFHESFHSSSSNFLRSSDLEEETALYKLAATSDTMKYIESEIISTIEEEHTNTSDDDDDCKSDDAHIFGSSSNNHLSNDVWQDDDDSMISKSLTNSLLNSPSSPAFSLDEKQQQPEPPMPSRPTMGQRRNTCGTLYMATTMADPDKDATIKCVCGVFRAHILQSEMDDCPDDTTTDDAAYRIFNDMESQQKTCKKKQQFKPKVDFVVKPPPPTLDDITTFYRDVFIRAQMEADCIIMSLIYVERLIKVTDGQLRPQVSNWRSILFACMLLSSKVWDDMSMWNADFSQTCPAGVVFSLQRINGLEIAVLDALAYTVKVPASEYAKYYFLLRSMIIKSGLAGQDLLDDRPLDIDSARRLQAVSERYQLSHVSNTTNSGNTNNKPSMGYRSKSLGANAIQKNDGTTEQDRKVGLEHLVKM